MSSIGVQNQGFYVARPPAGSNKWNLPQFWRGVDYDTLIGGSFTGPLEDPKNRTHQFWTPILLFVDQGILRWIYSVVPLLC